ncbi:sigma-70 family RNA polymerase sigma factor [Anseongella ginsenosidimutans]|nr:sigma-70 family RNA polymerase sigma factor [Anseongella ginsenosidimutans]
MYNVCLRIVDHSGEAEDILQESFIDAFDRLKEFRMEASVGSWLKRIVINNSVNWLRRRRINWVDIDGEELEIEEQEQDWDEIDMQVQAIREGIRKLSDGYRVVLSLYLLEGYDHEEIGSILHINEASSRSQYLRAKRKLLEILKCRQYERQA